MKIKLLLTSLIICCFSGCVAEKDDSFLNALKGLNKSLASVNSTMSSAGQNNNYSSALIAPTTEPLLSMQKGAWKNINSILNISACTAKNKSIYSKLIGFSSHDASIGNVNPKAYTPNHRQGCLTVKRIDGFEQISANSFKFSALFESPQSKESTRKEYQMIQETNGEWLLKRSN